MLNDDCVWEKCLFWKLNESNYVSIGSRQCSKSFIVWIRYIDSAHYSRLKAAISRILFADCLLIHRCVQKHSSWFLVISVYICASMWRPVVVRLHHLSFLCPGLQAHTRCERESDHLTSSLKQLVADGYKGKRKISSRPNGDDKDVVVIDEVVIATNSHKQWYLISTLQFYYSNSN